MKRKIMLMIVGTLLCLSLLMGVSYSYYKAGVTVNNETMSKIESNKLGLTYTGVKEINVSNMIPGDSFVKTFKVENTSTTTVTYNIYMESITNEFNDDLVYKITDEVGNVIVDETVLPTTNSGKTYLKSNISIEPSSTIHNYILIVEYKYHEDIPQNNYQGADFSAYLGVDSEIVA